MLKFVRFHFGWNGRLNRLSYFTLVLTCYCLALVVLYPATLSVDDKTISDIIAIPMIGIVIILLWIIFTGTIKRLHDMDKSGQWITIPVFLPMPINLFLLMDGQFMGVIVLQVIGTLILLPILIWVFFASGTIGKNQFGEGPTTKPKLKVLLGQD